LLAGAPASICSVDRTITMNRIRTSLPLGRSWHGWI
jgi:hypothetical protein